MKVYLLSGGAIDLDRAVIFPGDDSHRRVMVPVMQILIESEGKRVLFDTGMPPAAAGDTEGLQTTYGMDTTWMRPLMAREQRVDEQLRLLDLELSDLDLAVNTHFHFDHAGGNALFAGSGVPIAVQGAELEAATQGAGYLPIWDAEGLEFRSEWGDWSPLPGVEMLHTPGHTPGHQSMLVRVGNQPWLFTWDVVYTEEHWRTNKLGVVADVATGRESMERLRRIAADENARVIFGHDIAQWEALGMADRPKLVAET